MKCPKLAMSIIVVFFFVPGLRAQTLHTIEFDFATKTISTASQACMKKIKPGDMVAIKIKNFNPYLYQAQVNFTDSTIVLNTAPALFSSIFSASDLTTLVANLGAVASVIFPAANPSNPNTAHVRGGRPVPDDPHIQQMIQTDKNALLTAQNSLNTLIQDIQAYLFIQDIKLIITTKWSLDPNEIPTFTNADQTNYTNQVTDYMTRKNRIRSTALIAIGNYEGDALGAIGTIKGNPTLFSADSLIRLANKDFLQTMAAFDTTFSYDKFEAVLQKLVNLDKKNFEYTSFPTQVTGDVTNIAISLSPWNSASNLSSYKATWQFPALQKTFFGFSSDFYLTKLHADSYYAVPHVSSAGDTSYTISQEGTSSKVEVGISALFHYGRYIKNTNTSWMLSFGPGLSIQKNPQPRLLVGAGLGFGRKNKFLVNAGVILGEVQKESSYYKDSPSVNFPPTNITTSVLKANVFLTLGYAIF